MNIERSKDKLQLPQWIQLMNRLLEKDETPTARAGAVQNDNNKEG